MSDYEIPNKEVEIGGTTYKISAFTGTKSIRLCGKVVKIVGPSISEFFGGESEDDSVAKAVAVFSKSIGDEDISPVVKEMLSNTTKDGKAINLDFDFLGENFSHLPKLLVEVSLFNWGSVFQNFKI